MKTVTSQLSFPQLLVPVSASRARIDLEVLYLNLVSFGASGHIYTAHRHEFLAIRVYIFGCVIWTDTNWPSK